MNDPRGARPADSPVTPGPATYASGAIAAAFVVGWSLAEMYDRGTLPQPTGRQRAARTGVRPSGLAGPSAAGGTPAQARDPSQDVSGVSSSSEGAPDAQGKAR
jgi:hypothetical protein